MPKIESTWYSNGFAFLNFDFVEGQRMPTT